MHREDLLTYYLGAQYAPSPTQEVESDGETVVYDRDNYGLDMSTIELSIRALAKDEDFMGRFIYLQ